MLAISEYIKHPQKIVLGILNHCWFLFSDRVSLKLQYRINLGRKLNLKNPTRFTEKLQWLKLYNRKPEYTNMVDKIAVKDYVASIIGNKHIIPTFGTWQHFDDIDFDSLPEKFVLKTNHGGGGCDVILCRKKDMFDKSRAKIVIERSLKHRVYPYLREWPYKNVRPMILAEQLLDDIDVPDYKFYCFNGIPKVLLIASNRFSTHNFNYFDMDFRPLQIISLFGDPVNSDLVKRPSQFEKMKDIASRLSKGIPHVRVDLYEVKGNVFFGELTFFDSSGFDNMNSDTVDLEWGSWITLPLRKSR